MPQETHTNSSICVPFHLCHVIGRGGTPRPGWRQRAPGNVHGLCLFTHPSLKRPFRQSCLLSVSKIPAEHRQVMIIIFFDHQGPGGIRGPRGEKVNTTRAFPI